MTRTRVRLAPLVVAVLLGLGGCATVKPWEREDLSRRTMVDDREPGEERFDSHGRGAREGADGGSGRPGGGCGCN